MTTIHARAALLPDGWGEDVRISLAEGRIRRVETGVRPERDDCRCAAVVPAMANLHSHAFQRAMAGLAEVRGPSHDTFWSWRQTMYRFALQMSPDQMEAVAAFLYAEMLEAGFGRVGEFHYLHNQPDGTSYADPAELSRRIAAASLQAGIGLTLLPVYYAHSNFGGAAPVEGQRRFVMTVDNFARLMEESARTMADVPGGRLGVAPHSLRAVTLEELLAVVPLAGGGPVHMHVAEQIREVEDCIAHSGARPVEWLLDHAPVNDRWCLIHATHMTEGEARAMARRGAIAGLCPITEANLGDGFFEAVSFLDEGGRVGIGSDSNIFLSVANELRQLEYAQRLKLRQRNVVAEPFASTGRRLFDLALAGGGAALDAPVSISPGGTADLVALDTTAAPWLRGDQILDAFVFASGVRVDNVWVGGVQRVEGGRHRDRDALNRRFVWAMEEMLSA